MIRKSEDIDNKIDEGKFLNIVKLKGYITRKPEIKKTTSGISVSTFTLAVKRNYKNMDGNYDFDYINVILWRDLAEKASKLDEKTFVVVSGSIQTRTYTTENNERRYVTEVYCKDLEVQ